MVMKVVSRLVVAVVWRPQGTPRFSDRLGIGRAATAQERTIASRQPATRYVDSTWNSSTNASSQPPLTITISALSQAERAGSRHDTRVYAYSFWDARSASLRTVDHRRAGE